MPVAIPDARPELHVRMTLEPLDRRDHGQPGAHRPLGVVLVRDRPAKIGQDAVAQILSDMAFEPADDLRAGRLVRLHHRAQVLGIEPRRQRGRADQVAEQHGQLTAFGLDGPQRRCYRLCGSPRCIIFQQSDRIEQLAPVSDRRHAKRYQVLGGQPRQQLELDIVGPEGGGVILQAKIP